MDDSAARTIRTGALDWAKLVFAMLIVGIHVPMFASPCFGGLGGTLAFYAGRGCLVRIAVPGFFAITGYLFARSVTGLASFKEQWLRLLHVEKRLCLLWLVWAVPNISISIFHSCFMMKAPPKNLWTFDHFFWGGGYTVAWFLVATIMALPIVWLVQRAGSRMLFAFVFAFFYALCLAERTYSGIMPDCILHYVNRWTSIFSSPVFSFAIAVPFIAIGMWAWRTANNPIPPPLFMTAVCAVLYVVETYICRNFVPSPVCAKIDQNPLYIMLGPLVAALICWLARLDIPCNKTIRQLSVAVMMTHIGFRTFFNGLAHWGFVPNSLVSYCLIVALSVGTGFLLIALKRKTRWSLLDYAL